MFNKFNCRIDLAVQLAKTVATNLQDDITTKGSASLLISGGRTPLDFFQLLSVHNIDWKKVTIGLVDERFVPTNHEDSNEKLAKTYLLQNNASEATFFSLIYDDSNYFENLKIAEHEMANFNSPFSCVILGMGNDTHTASLFPKNINLLDGLNITKYDRKLIGITPETAKHSRISLTKNTILNTKNLYLHITGEDKKETYNKAYKSDNFIKNPIAAFIHQTEIPLNIYWAK